MFGHVHRQTQRKHTRGSRAHERDAPAHVGDEIAQPDKAIVAKIHFGASKRNFGSRTKNLDVRKSRPATTHQNGACTHRKPSTYKHRTFNVEGKTCTRASPSFDDFNLGLASSKPEARRSQVRRSLAASKLSRVQSHHARVQVSVSTYRVRRLHAPKFSVHRRNVFVDVSKSSVRARTKLVHTCNYRRAQTEVAHAAIHEMSRVRGRALCRRHER